MEEKGFEQKKLDEEKAKLDEILANWESIDWMGVIFGNVLREPPRVHRYEGEIPF